MSPPRYSIAAVFAIALLAGGCASISEFRLPGMPAAAGDSPDAASSQQAIVGEAGPPGTPQAPANPGERKLAEGIELYEKGDFAGAIRALSAPEIAGASIRTRVEAQKHLAFSYCVTQKRTLCRRAFDGLLRLDARYELHPVEAGHPLWGPVFTQARKAAERRAN